VKSGIFRRGWGAVEPDGMSLADLKTAMGKNRVKVLTVHVSKGLEAKNVILYGRFPVVVPSYQIDEEERRVMYVGVTRAQDRLIVLN
jgi:DNA helicase-2/ATP-dependent DNA helicase PcrA